MQPLTAKRSNGRCGLYGAIVDPTRAARVAEEVCEFMKAETETVEGQPQ